MRSSEEYDRLAYECFEDDRYIEAANILRKGLEVHPHHPELLEHLVVALDMAGEYVQCLKVWKRYADLGGCALVPFLCRCRSLIRLGRGEKALSALETMLPDRDFSEPEGERIVETLRQLMMHCENTRRETALLGRDFAGRMAEKHPSTPVFVFAEGYFRSHLDEADPVALRRMEEAVRLAPWRQDYICCRAQTLHDLGRDDEALAAWEQADLDEIRSIPSLRCMARLYTELRDDREAALACLQRIADIEIEDTIDAFLEDALAET